MKILKNKYVITLIFTLLIGVSLTCFSVYKNKYQSNITYDNNSLNLNGIEIISYVDGIEVSVLPNSCSYSTTVSNDKVNLTCDYLTNRWSIDFSDLTELPATITINFKSTDLPQDAYTYDYDYIASAHYWKEPYSIFTAPVDAYYKLETWGAQGLGTKGGFGGYSVGKITLNKGDNLYIYIGNTPSYTNNWSVGGYNGGGYSGNSNTTCGGGGGATHIARRTGLLKDLNENIDDIIIVSGGGGGGCNCNMGDGKCAGGSGGGIEGVKNITINSKYSNIYSGGNQTGPSGRTFGIASPQELSKFTGGGGGGGFYPGRHGSQSTGSGGSGYIGNTDLTSKYMYCYNCIESTDESTYTINTVGENELADKKNCPNGYSEEAISKCAKAGNGHARITFLRLVDKASN